MDAAGPVHLTEVAGLHMFVHCSCGGLKPGVWLTAAHSIEDLRLAAQRRLPRALYDFYDETN